jgi:signal transduction histidine kinase
MAGLEESKLFGSLSAEELKLIRENSALREHPANYQLFQEGDVGDGIYVVAEGQVQISAVIGNGERRVLSRVRPGEFFGEMAVLDNEPRSATATTEQPTKVFFIPRETLLKMLEKSPRLAVSLVREFSLRMRDFNRQYIQEVLQAERLTLVGRFARSIVHDFKNPLNIIGLAAELATMEKVSPEMRKTATDRIRKQVDRLSNMISELLEFTRGSQGPVVLSASNYGAFVKKIVEELQPDVQDKRATLILRNEPPDIDLPFDDKRMQHVFANLVNNAVDASGPGGNIFISVNIQPKEVVTEIEDSGPGIAAEILPRLFEAFATFGKAKGSGLGLSICKRVIEDHRGWITARNEPGRGAIFTFALPRS